MVYRKLKAQRYLALLIASVLLVAPTHAANKKPPNQKDTESPDARFVRQAVEFIDLNAWGAKAEIRKLKNLAKKKSALGDKAAAALARYYIFMKHKPIDAIKITLPHVVGKSAASEWKKQNKAGYEAAVAEYKEKLKLARAEKKAKADYPQKPSKQKLYSPLPLTGDLKVETGNSRAIIALAYAYMELRIFPKSLPLLKAVGEKSTDLPQVLANESAGDLFSHLQDYAQSINFFKHALSLERLLHKDKYGEPTGARYFGNATYIRGRIQRKLAEAIRLDEINRFGAGWVAWRDLDKKIRQDKDFVGALAASEAIQADFPKTIFRELGVKSRIQTLIALSEFKPTRKQKSPASKAVKKLEKRIKKMEFMHRGFRIRQLPKSIIKDFQVMIDEEKAALKKLMDIPYGEKAFAKATTLAAAYIKENPWGVFRGEVMLSLARVNLERKGDLKRAFKGYYDLHEWIIGVRKLQQELDAFRVPGKASKVAAAPKTFQKLAGWNGYIVRSEIAIGAVVNRLNCKWYLDAMQAECDKILSFCYFMKGDKANAEKMLDSAIRYDDWERKFFSEGQPNSYSRLRSCYKKGRLGRPADHNTLFKGKLRTIYLVADYYAVVEDEKRCQAIREKLIAGLYGKLNSGQMAAVKYRLAAVKFRQGNFEGAKKDLLEVVKINNKGKAAGWAYVGLGNIVLQNPDKQEQRKSIEYYSGALNTKIAKSEREKATFCLARAREYFGQREAANKLYRRLLKKFPKGTFRDLAKKGIENLGVESGKDDATQKKDK